MGYIDSEKGMFFQFPKNVFHNEYFLFRFKLNTILGIVKIFLLI